ncbi:MAG: hypothetical protein OFPI_05980 [Osedax symbiont Rs2]|nr:MAG: hypothetical protein OFPI_05980 [Osedax symbiont Rs2]
MDGHSRQSKRISCILSVLVASLSYPLFSVYIICGCFFLISLFRTYYEVYLTSYFYSLDTEISVKFITIRQSLASYAGIAITLLAAVSLNKEQPNFFHVKHYLLIIFYGDNLVL